MRPCRELNRAIREIFSLIRESALVTLFGICFDDRSSDPVFAEKAKRAPPDARSRRSRSRARSRLLSHVKGAPGIPGNLVAKFVDANKRRFGLRDGGVGPVARCQTHQLHPSCGTEPPLDMLMTLQVYMRNRSVRCRRALGGAPRSTRFGQLASSIYRSLTERLPRQHSAWEMRRVRAVCLPASEGVGPRVRIRLAPAASLSQQ